MSELNKETAFLRKENTIISYSTSCLLLGLWRKLTCFQTKTPEPKNVSTGLHCLQIKHSSPFGLFKEWYKDNAVPNKVVSNALTFSTSNKWVDLRSVVNTVQGQPECENALIRFNLSICKQPNFSTSNFSKNMNFLVGTKVLHIF